MTRLSRRQLLLTSTAAAILPRAAFADDYQEISWDDLIPPGVPYSEIIGNGDMDVMNDTWNPVFDENGVKLNMVLDGMAVKLPGYIIPIDVGTEGVTSFVFVPYTGACIHVPPPPPNQVVFVTSETPWPNDQLFDAVWVYGTMSAKLQSNELAQMGYEIKAEKMEIYEWT